MQHKPTLIEPSQIVIEQKSTVDTVYDPLTREPIKQVERDAAISLSAQISWGRSSSPRFDAGGQGGPVEEALGYVVIARDELVEKCVTLSRGDRISEIAGQAFDVYLTKKTLAGHHHGAPTLEVWDFIDYAPNKVASG